MMRAAMAPALGELGLAAGVEAVYRAEIDAADDPQAKLSEIEDRFAPGLLRSVRNDAHPRPSRKSTAIFCRRP
jgi:hypothetical protein